MPVEIRGLGLDEHERVIFVELKVTKRGEPDRREAVRIGDHFRTRARWPMVATVRGFYEDGSKAFVDRSTSRRKQAISTARLVTEYDRVERR